MQYYVSKLSEKKYSGLFLFLICWGIAIALYLPALNAMLIDDGVNGIYDLKKQGLGGLICSYHFDSFYHGYYLFLNLLYHSFGLHPLGWFLFFSFTHALNALLLFKFIFALANQNNEKQGFLIAIATSLFFLLSPLNAENVVWAATLHYNLSMCILLYSLLWLNRFLQNQTTPAGNLVFLLLNFFALITFELSFVFPFIYLLLYILFFKSGWSKIKFKTLFIRILFPIGAAICLYFLMLHIIRDTWMPHAGSDAVVVHSIPELLVQFYKYLLKMFGFVHYFNTHDRDYIYKLCVHWKKATLIALMVVGLIHLVFRKKEKDTFYTFLFLFCSGILMLLPFSVRYFNVLFRYENLRFTYFAGLFLYAAFVWLLFRLNTWPRYFIIIIFLCLSVVFLFRTVKDKRESAKVYHRYINTFPEASFSTIYVLNVPSFGNESYMFWDRSRLPISLYCYKDLAMEGKLEQVLFYNSIGTNDRFEVKKINDSAWTFQLKTNGSWLMNQFLGAGDYETEDYYCDLGEWGNYDLKLKHKPGPTEDVIYFDGEQFVSVK